jgi:hypothetical protein
MDHFIGLPSLRLHMNSRQTNSERGVTGSRKALLNFIVQIHVYLFFFGTLVAAIQQNAPE